MYNNDYYQLFYDLYHLVRQAYMDRGILEEMEQYFDISKKRSQKFNKFSYHVMEHFCDLTKADLALTLWKLTDTDNKANTINTLKTVLIKEHDKDIHAKLSKTTKATLEKISRMRNRFIAHNDIQRAGLSISITDMYAVLDDLREFLEQLCFKDIDERVTPFSESVASMYKAEVGIGLHLLLLNSSNSNITAEQQE